MQTMGTGCLPIHASHCKCKVQNFDQLTHRPECSCPTKPLLSNYDVPEGDPTPVLIPPADGLLTFPTYINAMCEIHMVGNNQTGLGGIVSASINCQTQVAPPATFTDLSKILPAATCQCMSLMITTLCFKYVAI